MSESSQPPAVPRPEPARIVVRGASAEILARPAGIYLAQLRWDGKPEAPEKLSAGAFLSRL